MRSFFMVLVGLSAGILSSAGVFTVLAAVGLVPRFAGRTHTASKILLYEEMVVFGAVAGCLVSVYPEYCQARAWVLEHFPGFRAGWRSLGVILQVVVGASSGVFVGCLALAIAEMLESIPILTRRMGFRHGLGWMILCVAAGKLAGAMIYFLTDFHRTVM